MTVGLYCMWLVLVSAPLSNLKLRNFFSPPESTQHKETEPQKLHKGTIYLMKGRNIERSYILFAEKAKEATSALIITRKNPLRIKSLYNLSDIPALWLSQKEEEDVLFPNQLHKLVYLISEAVFDQEGSLILLDGLEYLIVHNRFEDVLKQLYIIREVLSRHGAIMLIPVDPEAFSEKQLGFLEKESVSI
jgi:hypothetical protein